MDKLISAANNQPIHPQFIKDMMNASNDQEVNKVLADFSKERVFPLLKNQFTQLRVSRLKSSYIKKLCKLAHHRF